MTRETGSSISVGQELRRAREVRHVSLAQLSAETRIALRHLEALEEDRFEDLPGRLYARNFVRQVASSLGADEQELLDYFDYQSGQGGRATEAAESAQASLASRRRLAFGALAIAALIIVAALGFALTRDSTPAASSSPEDTVATEMAPPVAPSEVPVVASEQTATAEPVTPPASRAAPPEAKPEGAPARQASPAAVRPQAGPRAVARVAVAAAEPEPEPIVEPEPKPLPELKPEPAAPAEPAPPRVKLVFSGPSWVEIVPEGAGDQIMGLKTAGQELSFALASATELTVANAGNVELWLDGKPTRPLGVPGERRTLRLDSRNWQGFLR